MSESSLHLRPSPAQAYSCRRVFPPFQPQFTFQTLPPLPLKQFPHQLLRIGTLLQFEQNR